MTGLPGECRLHGGILKPSRQGHKQASSSFADLFGKQTLSGYPLGVRSCFKMQRLSVSTRRKENRNRQRGSRRCQTCSASLYSLDNWSKTFAIDQAFMWHPPPLTPR